MASKKAKNQGAPKSISGAEWLAPRAAPGPQSPSEVAAFLLDHVEDLFRVVSESKPSTPYGDAEKKALISAMKEAKSFATRLERRPSRGEWFMEGFRAGMWACGGMSALSSLGFAKAKKRKSQNALDAKHSERRSILAQAKLLCRTKKPSGGGALLLLLRADPTLKVPDTPNEQGYYTITSRSGMWSVTIKRLQHLVCEQR